MNANRDEFTQQTREIHSLALPLLVRATAVAVLVAGFLA